jgi:hypothetical protein
MARRIERVWWESRQHHKAVESQGRAYFWAAAKIQTRFVRYRRQTRYAGVIQRYYRGHLVSSSKSKPNQTKPKQNKPNQAKPSQTKTQVLCKTTEATVN